MIQQVNYRKIEKGGDESGDWDEVIALVEATDLHFREGMCIDITFGEDIGYMFFDGVLELEKMEELEIKLHEEDEGGCWSLLALRGVFDTTPLRQIGVSLRWIGNY